MPPLFHIALGIQGEEIIHQWEPSVLALAVRESLYHSVTRQLERRREEMTGCVGSWVEVPIG